MKIGGFSDFYTSLEHCQNVSPPRVIRWLLPCNSLVSVFGRNDLGGHCEELVVRPIRLQLPRIVHRADSIRHTAASERGLQRRLRLPSPPTAPPKNSTSSSRWGFSLASPSGFGQQMPIADARDHVFGFVMLNDWSARDHQLFEMRPLGPFHSKGIRDVH